MESRLTYKLAQLRDALDNFEASLSIDTDAPSKGSPCSGMSSRR